jgi:predicted phage-related endonuclease
MFEIYHKAKKVIELKQQIAGLECEKKALENNLKEYLQKESAHVAHILDVHLLLERETSRRISLTAAKKVLSPAVIDSICTVSEYERIKVW